MNEPGRSQGKKAVSSPHFLANLMVVFLGILFYLGLSHFSDLLNLLRSFYQMIWPFVTAFIIAWLVNPIVRFFENKVFRRGRLKLRRGLAITCSYVAVLLLIGALMYIILPQVYESLLMLIDKVPSYLKGLSGMVNDLADRFSLLDTENASFIVDTYTDLITRLTGWVQSILPKVLNFGVSVGSSIVNMLMAFIASIYMLADKERLKNAAKKCVLALVPAPYDVKVLQTLRHSNEIFTGFIDGKLLDSLIIGVLCFIGTLLLRIPFAGLISLIVGVTNIIPFFGPFIGAVPCTLILLIVDPWSALWFLIFVVALQQLDGNVIGPRILGDSTGVSALGVLVSISLGGSLGGVAGMLLGVPVYAIVSVLWREYLDLRLLKKKMKEQQKQEAAEEDASVQEAQAEACPQNEPKPTTPEKDEKEDTSSNDSKDASEGKNPFEKVDEAKPSESLEKAPPDSSSKPTEENRKEEAAKSSKGFFHSKNTSKENDR